MTNDITINKGDLLPITFSILDGSSARDLTGYSGTISLKYELSSGSTSTVLSKAVTITSGTGGTGSVNLLPSETTLLSVGTYSYEIVFTSGTSIEITPISSTITVIDSNTSKGYTNESLIEAELGTSITSSTTPNSTQLNQWIKEAEAQIEGKLGQMFGSTTATNFVQSYDEHTSLKEDLSPVYSSMGHDYSGLNLNTSTFLVDNNGLRIYPIISITSLYRNVAGDTEADSWELLTENTGSSGDFILDKLNGKIIFINKLPIRGKKRAIKWSGTYGSSSVPVEIQMLATKIVAQRAMQVKIKKGMMSNTDSYSLEGFSRKKELSQNVSYLQELDRELDRIWEDISGTFQSEIVK
jgi:hypothetical protein